MQLRWLWTFSWPQMLIRTIVASAFQPAPIFCTSRINRLFCAFVDGLVPGALSSFPFMSVLITSSDCSHQLFTYPYILFALQCHTIKNSDSMIDNSERRVTMRFLVVLYLPEWFLAAVGHWSLDKWGSAVNYILRLSLSHIKVLLAPCAGLLGTLLTNGLTYSMCLPERKFYPLSRALTLGPSTNDDILTKSVAFDMSFGYAHYANNT